MKPLTNKGQVLVAFILLLPFLLFLCAIVIDFGLISVEKRKITNTVNDTLNYAKTQKKSEDLEEIVEQMIKQSISDVDVLEITSNDDSVEIHLEKELDSGFKELFDEDIYEINITEKIYYKE